MRNISIESFKWLKKEIIQKPEQKLFHYVIHKDAFLSKGASNEKMASQDCQLHLWDTDSENTSLLINNSKISLLFPLDTFIVNFAGALRQALAYLACSRHVAVRHGHEN